MAPFWILGWSLAACAAGGANGGASTVAPGGVQDAPGSVAPAPAGGSASGKAVAPGAPRVTDVAGLRAAMAADPAPIVLDVRTDEEFASGHVPGAVHIPVDGLDGRVSELEAYRHRPIYVICRSGRRSAIAAERLVSRGFTDVTNVGGGTEAWIAAGGPVQRE